MILVLHTVPSHADRPNWWSSWPARSLAWGFAAPNWERGLRVEAEGCLSMRGQENFPELPQKLESSFCAAPSSFEFDPLLSVDARAWKKGFRFRPAIPSQGPAASWVPKDPWLKVFFATSTSLVIFFRCVWGTFRLLPGFLFWKRLRLWEFHSFANGAMTSDKCNYQVWLP